MWGKLSSWCSLPGGTSPPPPKKGAFPWPESRIPMCTFLMKYLKKGRFGSIFKNLLSRGRKETYAHTTHAEKEKSQTFSASHLILSSPNPHEVSGVSIFQIRRLRLREVTQSRNVSPSFIPAAWSSLAPSNQQANTGWRDWWKTKGRKGKAGPSSKPRWA